MQSSIETKNKIQHDKVIKASRFKKDVRSTTPHKHNSYFELLYIRKGSGYHHIDTNRYEVTPGSLYLINHEQTHHWALDSEPDGFVVIIKSGFLEQSIDKELKVLIHHLSKNNHLVLHDKDTIYQLLALLVQEVELSVNSTNMIVEGILKAIFGKIMQDPGYLPAFKASSNGLCYDFVNLLNQNNELKNSVSFYAQQLNTSPQNLNQACKKEMNATASKVLSDFILNEVKRLLAYTDLNISEVAHRLSFTDASHFIKYFKRYTGITPQTYRAQFR